MYGQPQLGYGPQTETYYGQPTPQGAPGLTPPTQDDWAADPVGAQQRYTQYMYQTQVAPQFSATFQQQADIALEMVRQQDPEAFRRWEPEIRMNLNAVDRQYWTPQNIRKVVGMVKAEHMDEFVAAKANALLEERIAAGSLSRPSDSGAVPPSAAPANALDLSKLPPERRAMLEGTRLLVNDRLTPAFDEFCDKMKKPSQSRADFAAEWLKAASAGDVIVESLAGATRVTEAS